MIDTLQFLNYDLIVPIAIGAVLLFVVFVWKEWTLPLRLRFYLHSIVTLVSIFSLSMLVLKPAYWSSAATTAGVLLTEGYKKEQLDSLKKEHKGLRVVQYQNNVPMGEVLDSINPLFMLGEGVRSFDFWQFEKRNVNYLGGELLQGTTRLNYERKLSVGDSLVVRGQYLKSIKGHKLILADDGGNEIDSVLLEGDAKSDFELSTELKVSGSYLYEIREKDSLGETVSNNPLPLQVLPREKLKILLANSFPTFESKYLKNFLADAGNELIVRTQLTRGKYKFEYLNTERRPIYSLDGKLMKSFDLTIIDANSYRNLSQKSVRVIMEAISSGGQGLLILPDTGFFRLPSKASNFEFSKAKSAKTSWDKWPKLTLEKYPYQFEENLRLEEIHRSKDEVLTAYQRKGRGRIGTTLVQNSYQLLLNGNSQVYKQFWSEIITTLGKRKSDSVAWHFDVNFPVKDEPIFFELRTSEENPQVIGENGKIPLMQNPDMRELWYGTTYPRTKGWHEMRLEKDSTAVMNFFVMDSTKWKSVKSFKTMVENSRQFNSLSDLPVSKKILKAIEPLWFFLLFLLGMGYLWLAPKFLSNY